MRFMRMVKASAATEANVMPTEAQFAEMGAYNEQLIKAGVMKDGMGLQSSEKGARIHIKGKEKRWVEDGPFAETKELIAGFWIIEVASKEEAIAWARAKPSTRCAISSFARCLEGPASWAARASARGL